MFSLEERPPKRRLIEIDNKIKIVSDVINTMTGPEKYDFKRKIINVQLKKQKIAALAAIAEAQKMNGVLTEIDIQITESDIDTELEAIRSSKKFRKSKESMIRENHSEIEDHFLTANTDPNISSNSSNQTINDLDQNSVTKPIKSPTKEQQMYRFNEALEIAEEIIKKKSVVNTVIKAALDRENIPFDLEFEPAPSKYQVPNKVPSDVTNRSSQDAIESTSKAKKIYCKKLPLLSKKQNTVKDSATRSNYEKVDLTKRGLINPTDTTETKQTVFEPSKTHSNIINLFENYKKIYSPEISTTQDIIQRQKLRSNEDLQKTLNFGNNFASNSKCCESDENNYNIFEDTITTNNKDSKLESTKSHTEQFNYAVNASSDSEKSYKSVANRCNMQYAIDNMIKNQNFTSLSTKLHSEKSNKDKYKIKKSKSSHKKYSKNREYDKDKKDCTAKRESKSGKEKALKFKKY